MARFIMDGLTGMDIIRLGREAGYERPCMELAAQDLGTCLPYIAEASDAVAKECDGNTIAAFMARDSELLYDDYVIAHPDKRAILLPASIDMLDSESMSDSNLAQRFYAAYGLDRPWVDDSKQKLLGVDTGYHGDAVRRTVFALANAYDVDPRVLLARTSTRLVCSFNDIPEILEINDNPATIAARLPRLRRAIGPCDYNKETALPPAWYLASALQIMPRRHGHFNGLTEEPDGMVTATTQSEPISQDVDTTVQTTESLVNTSPVNPMAALYTQFRVVDHALRRVEAPDRYRETYGSYEISWPRV